MKYSEIKTHCNCGSFLFCQSFSSPLLVAASLFPCCLQPFHLKSSTIIRSGAKSSWSTKAEAKELGTRTILPLHQHILTTTFESCTNFENNKDKEEDFPLVQPSPPAIGVFFQYGCRFAGCRYYLSALT